METKKPVNNKIKRTEAFDVVNIIILALFLIMILVPFYYTVVKSFMTEYEYLKGGLRLWPKDWSLVNYKQIFEDKSLVRSFLNTIIIVVAGVPYSMFLTTTLAYGFSKKGYPGRGFFQFLVVLTMYFSGGLIPFFLLVKDLGLMGSRLSVILPMGLNVFNMVIMRSFFEQLPPDLEEAALIDGAGPIRIFVQITLPLVKPALATLTLFYTVDRWNEWFYSSLFLTNSKLWPMQLQLRQILQSDRELLINMQELGYTPFSEGLKSSAMILTMIPIMCVYPFLQKYFVKGVMIGAIKS